MKRREQDIGWLVLVNFKIKNIDKPIIRTTLEFKIKAKKDLKIYANGIEKEEKIIDEEFKESHWVCDFPCPSYLITFAVGNFNELEVINEETKIPIKYIGSKGITNEQLKMTFEETPKIIKYLENKIGVEFPFKKYLYFIF
jgi:aminopeptidase N